MVQWAEDTGIQAREVSSKTGDGVDALFEELVITALRRRAPPASPRHSPNKVYAQSPFDDDYDRRIASEVSTPESPDTMKLERRDSKLKKCCS